MPPPLYIRASLAHEQGDMDLALQLFNSGLNTALVEGSEKDAALYYAGMGIIYLHLRRLCSAHEMFDRSVRLYQMVLGDHHTDTAKVMLAHSRVYFSTGSLQKAADMQESIAAIFSKAGTLFRSELGVTYVQWGLSLTNMGKVAEAEEAFKKGILCHRRADPFSASNLMTALHGMASLVTQQERWLEAKELYTESLMLSRAHHGDEHSMTASCLHSLAIIYRCRGLSDRAKEYGRWATTVYKNSQTPVPPELEEYLSH